jgi:hypothetical protein
VAWDLVLPTSTRRVGHLDCAEQREVSVASPKKKVAAAFPRTTATVVNRCLTNRYSQPHGSDGHSNPLLGEYNRESVTADGDGVAFRILSAAAQLKGIGTFHENSVRWQHDPLK